MTPLESYFLTILQAHRGLDNAISVPAMASQLGVSQRLAQEVKKTLVEQHGVNIGSSCGKRHGWFIPETESEVRAHHESISGSGEESLHPHRQNDGRSESLRCHASTSLGI